MDGEEKVFECPICSKGFKLKARLVRHLDIHRPDRPFPCEICEKSFKSKDELKVCFFDQILDHFLFNFFIKIPETRRRPRRLQKFQMWPLWVRLQEKLPFVGPFEAARFGENLIWWIFCIKFENKGKLWIFDAFWIFRPIFVNFLCFLSIFGATSLQGILQQGI